MHKPTLALFLSLLASPALAGRSVVVELYTSQGCSSCPPADALLVELAADPSLLALSFHVHYWDYLGWKDPFSLSASTDRQRAYASILRERTYTPQMVIDGVYSVVGSNRSKVHSAIARAQGVMRTIPVTLTPDETNRALDIHIPAVSGDYGRVDVWEIRFKPRAVTPVAAGENKGRTIENANNVTAIHHLGFWQQKEWRHRLDLNAVSGDGIAVLLQDGQKGLILGAASYLHPSR